MRLFPWAIIDWDDQDDTHHSDLERGFWFADMGTSSVQAIRTFANRWGNLEQETFRQALIAGDEQNRVIAMWVLTWTQDPQTQALLLPFLHSGSSKERWSAALCLGELAVPQALPVLCTMLREFLPSEGHPYPLGEVEAIYWYDDHRWLIPSILRLWRDSSIVIALRRALEEQVRAEQYTQIEKQGWFIMEDILAYELGYRGAFGALTESSLPPHRYRIALINIVLGYYNASTYPEKYYGFEPSADIINDTNVRPLLKDLLMARFGFAEEAAEQYLKGYFEDWNVREMYESGLPSPNDFAEWPSHNREDEEPPSERK